jgi:cell division initiation protein
MMTVKEINEVSFGKASFSGYKSEDVDNFIDAVVASYQELLNQRDEAIKKTADLAAQIASLQSQNADMQKKLAILAEKVESYRKEEDGIKDAILSAQRFSRSTVQEAKDKAQIILEDAEATARQMLDEAKIDAAKAAKEYKAQAEAKREELEEMKRQVSSFKVSILEMYKKHLDCINHIPTFRFKEERVEEPVVQKPVYQAPAAPAAPVAAPAPVQEPVYQEPETAPVVEETAPQPAVYEEPAVSSPVSSEPTLSDKVDYIRQSVENAAPETMIPPEDDLTDMGIDIRAYSDIPETLKKEKSSHFSNLEFGDDVDLGTKKRRR